MTEQDGRARLDGEMKTKKKEGKKVSNLGVGLADGSAIAAGRRRLAVGAQVGEVGQVGHVSLARLRRVVGQRLSGGRRRSLRRPSRRRRRRFILGRIAGRRAVQRQRRAFIVLEIRSIIIGSRNTE